MAQAWIRDSRGGAGWLAAVLQEKNCYAICPNSDAPLMAISADAARVDAAILRQGRGESWLLLLSPSASVFVNGQRLVLGMRVLRDRDEILLPGIPRNDGEQADVEDAEPHRLFFSTERLAVVEPFPGGAKAVFCSRCKQVIDAGHLAVRCPSGRCGLWHHESAEQPCWTYAEKCSNCDQLTALDAGYRWTPEQL